jgi:hypothetical protein
MRLRVYLKKYRNRSYPKTINRKLKTITHEKSLKRVRYKPVCRQGRRAPEGVFVLTNVLYPVKILSDRHTRTMGF